MNPQPLNIIQVNATAHGGGAEQVVRKLHAEYRHEGHRAWLLVGRGQATGSHVQSFQGGLRTTLAHALAGPLRILDRQRGLETYRYPATRRMLDSVPAEPDVVHLHNLHGGYFDLRVLPRLSARHRVVLTLHDAWLLSGHCAHSLGCDRWRTGCGSCPDLTIYPAVRRDATARNWTRKRDIFAASRLHVATPSQWLADRVEHSMLRAAVEELRVIPNGVDLDRFRPGDQSAARSLLELPPGHPVLLMVGSNLGENPFKDFDTVRRAAGRAAEMLGRGATLVVLGGRGPDSHDDLLSIRHVPFQEDEDRVVAFYQACDVYLHAARADTFPLSVIEALACGKPVVATAVGGIPEQVRSQESGAGAVAWPGFDGDEATGFLVAPADSEAMARAASRLLQDENLRNRLGHNAAADARRRFDAREQSRSYLEWYRSILSRHRFVRPDGTAPVSAEGRRPGPS